MKFAGPAISSSQGPNFRLRRPAAGRVCASGRRPWLRSSCQSSSRRDVNAEARSARRWMKSWGTKIEEKNFGFWILNEEPEGAAQGPSCIKHPKSKISSSSSALRWRAERRAIHPATCWRRPRRGRSRQTAGSARGRGAALRSCTPRWARSPRARGLRPTAAARAGGR